jgi:hypothetical protein
LPLFNSGVQFATVLQEGDSFPKCIHKAFMDVLFGLNDKPLSSSKCVLCY